MNKYLKIKINGFNIKSLLLINYLSKYNYKFYVDVSNNLDTKSNYKNKFYTITNFTKKILQDLNLLEKLENKIYGFNSYSYYNNCFKEEILISNKLFNSKDSNEGNLGWTLNHSDLEEVLLDQLSNNKNIIYLKKNEYSNLSQIRYDYELYFGSFNKYIKSKNILLFNNPDISSSLIFKVMVRGNPSRRSYEIFLKKDSILMIPLSKNIYQIVWKSNYKKIKDQMNMNVNLLLDNLSTVLPKGFKLDQIVGDVYFSSNKLSSFNNINFENNKFYFNDFNAVSNNLIIDELKSYIIDLNYLHQKFLTNKNFDISISFKFKIKHYLKRFLNFSIKLFFKNIIFRLFVGLKIFPYLFIQSPLLKFNKHKCIKNFINSISKSIFLILIK